MVVIVVHSDSAGILIEATVAATVTFQYHSSVVRPLLLKTMSMPGIRENHTNVSDRRSDSSSMDLNSWPDYAMIALINAIRPWLSRAWNTTNQAMVEPGMIHKKQGHKAALS